MEVQERVSSSNRLGKCNLPPVQLPKQFDNSAKLYLRDKDKVILKTVEEKLENFLLCRRIGLTRQNYVQAPNPDPSPKPLLHKLTSNNPNCSKKENPYNWKQVVYDEYNAAAHLISRSPAVYASVLRILTEIKRNCPSFFPLSLLDFGSGTGTSVWAANHLWWEHIKQYVCVDSSSEMNRLALFLFSGGDLNQHFPGLFIRQYLPVSFQCNYDIVVSSYALSEMPTEKDRINMLKLLWGKTNRFLVVIEHGNFYGYYIIQEARNLFLNGLEGADSKKAQVWKSFKTAPKVFAPCPHERDCPKWGQPSGCKFTQTYITPNYAQRFRKTIKQQEVFSYVVFDKQRGDLIRWPRFIHDPVQQNKCMHCHLCTAEGQISHIGITTAKHGTKLRLIAKVSKLGDCWPYGNICKEQSTNKKFGKKYSKGHKQLN